MRTSYLFKHSNYLTRTAIEREQKQFIKIAFAVHLSAVISAERYRSDSGALKSAVSILVYFYIIMINKYRQSAKRRLLLSNPTDRTFENRHVGCKEREKINRRRTLCTLRINFFEATPQTACIFSKEYYRYDANGYITAEKDGPFTEKEDFTFTYSYFAEHDVYGVDYGFDLEPPEDDPANLESGGTTSTTPTGGYRRDYIWNERNLLIKSDDKLNTVIYRYGDDGQRALKFTQQSNSETLYFNNFYSVHQVAHEPNHEHGLRVSKHIFVGNSRLVTAMTHADNHGDTTEQTEKRYYYHADHLQSAQFITNVRGEQYEHIEYTPYGELWIEETAPGIDKLPFRFTGKELDEETGLYYYGARYLDPKYSRWLSGDPALNDYIPKAPIDDEAKKHNENLPGMGGVFNVVNLHVYHYAGNNPVKYIDPDGRLLINNVSENSASAREYERNHNLRYIAFLIKTLDAKGNPQIPIGNIDIILERGLNKSLTLANAVKNNPNYVVDVKAIASETKNGNYQIDIDVSVFHYGVDGKLVYDVNNSGTIAFADSSELGVFGPNSSINQKLVNQKANEVINTVLHISNANLVEDK